MVGKERLLAKNRRTCMKKIIQQIRLTEMVVVDVDGKRQ